MSAQDAGARERIPFAASPPKSDRRAIVALIAELPATALLTPREAALYIATTPEVLRTWRATGRGPRFKGRGHFIRYQKAVLDEFMSGHDRD